MHGPHTSLSYMASDDDRSPTSDEDFDLDNPGLEDGAIAALLEPLMPPAPDLSVQQLRQVSPGLTLYPFLR